MRSSDKSDGTAANDKVNAFDKSPSVGSSGSVKRSQHSVWEQTASLAEALMPNSRLKEDFLEHLTRAIQAEVDPELNEEYNPKHWFVENLVFKCIITCLILINSIMMGVEVDTQDWAGWKISNHAFAACFFIEMVIKLYVLRLDYFYDKWNWMDCVLALMGFIDTWVMTILQQDDAGLQQFSILRLVRLVRLLRLARLFKSFTKLVIVMRSIVDAIQTTCWVTFVLTICIYVCAIFCVEVIGRAPPETYPGYAVVEVDIDEQEFMMNFNPHVVFGNLASSMLTLFNVAIFAEWAEVVRPVWMKQPGMIPFFLIFAVFVCFGVMNVIIGMIVDSVMINAREMEKEEEHYARVEKIRVIEELKEVIFTIDHNGDNKIDIDELTECLKTNSQINGLMQRAKLPYHLSPFELLNMLDNDGDGALQFQEFIGAFYRLIHADSFQQTCMLQMGINELKNSIRKLSKTMTVRMDKIDTALLGLSRGYKSDYRLAGTGVSELRAADREQVAQVKIDTAWTTRPEDVRSGLAKMQHVVGMAVQQKLEQEVNDLLTFLRCEEKVNYRAAVNDEIRKPKNDLQRTNDSLLASTLPNVISSSEASSDSLSECDHARDVDSKLFLAAQAFDDDKQQQRDGRYPRKNSEWC